MAATKTTRTTAAKKRPAARAGGAAKTPASTRRRNAERHVSVRMYNVGFGDAFLVQVPDGRKPPKRILFDCGTIQASDAGGPMKGIVKRIVEDVTDADGVARIDVVVATHRHKDHVSGFSDAAWDDVEVKEVWMPWTEHPADDDARRIREIQARMALGLQLSLKALAATADDAGRREMERYQGIVENALMLSNDKAMKTLHSGFGGDAKRRFLPGKTSDTRSFETDVLPGVKVHVLGPSRSRDVIRDMNPPKGESFLRLRNALDAGTQAPPAPFASDFVDPSPLLGGYVSDLDRAEIQRAGSISDLAVAVALDKAVNGTSLMLILEVAGSYLLFPGDAQWGTWLAAMEDTQWREMLARVSFYKIGHHGSHNATPRRFVDELLPVGCCAMASTLTRTIWPDIPRGPLLTGLIARQANVARSDQAPPTGQAFRVDRGVTEARIPL